MLRRKLDEAVLQLSSAKEDLLELEARTSSKHLLEWAAMPTEPKVKKHKLVESVYRMSKQLGDVARMYEHVK